jgi:hypothetical protein
MRRASVVLLAAAGVTLGGCVSHDYARIDAEAGVYWGYSDQRNGDGGYTVRVVLPVGPDLAYDYFNRRAEELCGGEPARKRVHTAVRPTMLYDRYGGQAGHFVLEGVVYCQAPATTEPAPVAVVAPTS